MILKVRENLELELKEWTGGTKRKFMDLFKNKGMNIKESDVHDILIKPYIVPNDVFLNSAEFQYILIELKRMNFKNEFKFEMKCAHCEDSFIVETTLSDVTNYISGKLSTIDTDLTKLRDIPNQELFDDIIKKYPSENKMYLQLILSILRIKDKESESIELTKESLENLTISEYNELEEFFIENESSLDLALEIECPECNIGDVYEFDSLPNFFEDMLPKNLNKG